jgi:hypothetical protein
MSALDCAPSAVRFFQTTGSPYPVIAMLDSVVMMWPKGPTIIQVNRINRAESFNSTDGELPYLVGDVCRRLLTLLVYRQA